MVSVASLQQLRGDGGVCHQGGKERSQQSFRRQRRSILDNWNYYRCNIVLLFVFISSVMVYHSSYRTNIHILELRTIVTC